MVANEILPDDTVLTREHIDFLRKRGACISAEKYLGWTVGKAAKARPWAALQYAADRLTPERMDACAAAEPWPALVYAADRLTVERRAWCEQITG